MPIYCTLSCDEGYAFAYQALDDYYCPAAKKSATPIFDDLYIDKEMERNNDYFSNPALDDIEIILPGKLEQNFSIQEPANRKKRSLAIPIMEPQAWLPESNPIPFPDCSVVYHATMAMTSASMMFDLPEDETDMDTFCDDSYFLSQVSTDIRKRITEMLSQVCTEGLECDLAELDSICEDILIDQKRSRRSTLSMRDKWNQIKKKRRKKRKLRILFRMLGLF